MGHPRDFRSLGVVALLCCFSPLAFAQPADAQATSANEPADKVGQRQTATEVAPNFHPLDRINTRLQSRIQSRVQSRLQRNSDLKVGASSAIKGASDQARLTERPQ